MSDYTAGIKEITTQLDSANSTNNNAEAAADRLRADFLKCSEQGMGAGEAGRARWNSIVKDVTSGEVNGKGWDARYSDKNNDGLLEMSIYDPATGCDLLWNVGQDTKEINRADSSRKGALHHAESSADNSTVYKEARF